MLKQHTPVWQCKTTSGEPSAADSSYAIGPIDPAQLLLLQAYLPDSLEITLWFPKALPLSLLTHHHFKEGYDGGYDCGEGDALDPAWTVHTLVNDIYFTLDLELFGETDLAFYALIVGFLIGRLSSLAQYDRMLARVGLAHLCFLLRFLPVDQPDTWARGLNRAYEAHKMAMDAYRSRVSIYRAQGKSFKKAQRLALATPTHSKAHRLHRKGKGRPC